MKFVALKATVAVVALVTGSTALAQHDGHQMPPEQAATAPSDPHAGHDMSAPDPPAGNDMSAPEPAALDPHAGHSAMQALTGALGSYPMAREASGTAWQPDSSEHGGVHLASGEWSFMAPAISTSPQLQEKPRAIQDLCAGMLMGWPAGRSAMARCRSGDVSPAAEESRLSIAAIQRRYLQRS